MMKKTALAALGAALLSSDPNLDNPIPTQFWMDRGYNICCS